MSKRIGLDSYFSLISHAVALRSTCGRRKVGAVLVKEGRIISTGYNGAPPGMQHCSDSGCVKHGENCVNTIHAETNCIIRAREQGDTLYCTDKPCLSCLKAAISHNPKIRIVYCRDYEDPARETFLNAHGDDVSFTMEKYRIDFSPLFYDILNAAEQGNYQE